MSETKVPIRDSATAALTSAMGALLRPGFVWAPIVLALLITIPTIILIPDTFATTQPFGRPMTQAEAREFLDRFGELVLPYIGVSALVGFLVSPLYLVVLYGLANDYLDGLPPRPFRAGFVALAVRMFVVNLILTAVYLAFALAGGLIAWLLLTSGAGVFLVLFMPILIVFLIIVVLRLVTVVPLAIEGRDALDAIQTGWAMTEGHVQQIFRWLFVTGLIVAIVGGIANALAGQVGGLIVGPRLGIVLGVLISGPTAFLSAIIGTMLTRLLQHGPTAGAPPARAPGPDWGAPPPA